MKWNWQGLNPQGEKLSGQIEAKNITEVRKYLRSQRIRVVEIQKLSLFELDLSEWFLRRFWLRSIRKRDLGYFTKQMAIMLDSGIPLLQALEVLFKQQRNPLFRKIIKNLTNSVGSGKTFYESLLQEKIFSKFYCNLVRTGEAAGVLDTSLNRISDYLEKQDKIKKRIKNALLYPVIVSVVGALVIGFMLTFIVPQFATMLNNSGQELPQLTQIILGLSGAISRHWILLLLVFLGVIIAGKELIKTTVGKKIYDRFSMNNPITKSIVIGSNLSSFSQTLSTLLAAGVPLVDALDICVDIVDNKIISRDVDRIKNAVITGSTLTSPLYRISYFPQMMVQMIKVGESTGNIDKMLAKVHEVLETDVEESIELSSKLIEPFVLIILGGMVATILLGVYMPIVMSAGGGL